MEHSHAAFEAYDGVLIRLAGGRAVKVPAFTVEEATRWWRFSSSVEDGGDAPGGQELIESLPARFGVIDERLEDLRVVQVGTRPLRVLDIEAPWSQLSFGDLTVREAFALAALYVKATADTYAAASSRAKIQVQASFRSALGLASPTVAETFSCAHAFTEAMYRHIYGLAEDFSCHPVLGPLTGVRARAAGSGPMLGSTT